jgi:hypothetical protein
VAIIIIIIGGGGALSLDGPIVPAPAGSAAPGELETQPL